MAERVRPGIIYPNGATKQASWASFTHRKTLGKPVFNVNQVPLLRGLRLAGAGQAKFGPLLAA